MKRTLVVAAAVVTALTCLGAGFALGASLKQKSNHDVLVKAEQLAFQEGQIQNEIKALQQQLTVVDKERMTLESQVWGAATPSATVSPPPKK